MSILLCYDGSPSSKRAVELARAVLAKSEIILLYVWNPPPVAVADAFGDRGDSEPEPESLEMLELERAREITDEGLELIARPGLAASVDVQIERNTSGDVARTILDAAERLGSDLIVIGTHGATAVQEGLLGSVSSELVHHSTTPVLVVPFAQPAPNGGSSATSNVRVLVADGAQPGDRAR
jgi:nucleotide-binding universal stress UspA family protein